MQKTKSELEQKMWAVVVSDVVLLRDKTYRKCVKFLHQQPELTNEFAIVTNDVADRMTKHEVTSCS